MHGRGSWSGDLRGSPACLNCFCAGGMLCRATQVAITPSTAPTASLSSKRSDGCGCLRAFEPATRLLLRAGSTGLLSVGGLPLIGCRAH
eukprot:2426367-Pyramimonas_sp.AAC.1